VGDSFDNLWNRAADEHVRLCAFDLLEIEGEDFRAKPLTERKRRLAQFLRKDRDGLEYVDHMEGDGTTIFKHACKLGLEGIVCKRIDVSSRTVQALAEAEEPRPPIDHAGQAGFRTGTATGPVEMAVPLGTFHSRSRLGL
jgi:hypothetical protein